MIAPKTPPQSQSELKMAELVLGEELVAPQTKVRPSRLRFNSRRWVQKVAIPVAVMILWVAITETRVVDRIFIPSPSDLWNSLVSMRGSLPSAIVASATMTLIGFVGGTAYGILSGLLMAYSKVSRELFGGLLDFIRPVPLLALIPMFVLWFGVGKLPQIALIALGTSVIVSVTTIEAIRNVSPVHIRAALTLGASRRTIYRTVAIPSITPHLLGAIRVAAAASWGLDVAAEFIGAQSGLGYTMIVRQQYLDTSGILLIVIVYSVMAVLLDTAIRMAEKPLTRWTERSVRTGVVASIVGQA